jgi:hypothetical protein
LVSVSLTSVADTLKLNTRIRLKKRFFKFIIKLI